MRSFFFICLFHLSFRFPFCFCFFSFAFVLFKFFLSSLDTPLLLFSAFSLVLGLPFLHRPSWVGGGSPFLLGLGVGLPSRLLPDPDHQRDCKGGAERKRDPNRTLEKGGWGQLSCLEWPFLLVLRRCPCFLGSGLVHSWSWGWPGFLLPSCSWLAIASPISWGRVENLAWRWSWCRQHSFSGWATDRHLPTRQKRRGKQHHLVGETATPPTRKAKTQAAPTEEEEERSSTHRRRKEGSTTHKERRKHPPPKEGGDQAAPPSRREGQHSPTKRRRRNAASPLYLHLPPLTR